MGVRGIDRSDGAFTDAWLAAVVDAARPEVGRAEPVALRVSAGHSNPMAELRFSDGRSLMVKRSPHRWAVPRFAASRRASALLRERAGVVAPRHVPLPPELEAIPLEAYWRVPLPTLDALWPSIPAAARPSALRSWGRLLRRIHDVRLPGHGPLERAARAATPLRAFLERDIGGRLLPAVAETWPAGRDVVAALAGAAPRIAARVGRAVATLLHNDLHMGNVLCEVRRGRVHCVGVLDLEAAFAGPPEADLAHTEVLHGPLFGQHLPGDWLAAFHEGYGAAGDPAARAFFRAYHLVNLGFHAALTGLDAHARDVARAAAADLATLTATARPATFPADRGRAELRRPPQSSGGAERLGHAGGGRLS